MLSMADLEIWSSWLESQLRGTSYKIAKVRLVAEQNLNLLKSLH